MKIIYAFLIVVTFLSVGYLLLSILGKSFEPILMAFQGLA